MSCVPDSQILFHHQNEENSFACVPIYLGLALHVFFFHSSLWVVLSLTPILSYSIWHNQYVNLVACLLSNLQISCFIVSISTKYLRCLENSILEIHTYIPQRTWTPHETKKKLLLIKETFRNQWTKLKQIVLLELTNKNFSTNYTHQ
jgi:hypothetical protein